MIGHEIGSSPVRVYTTFKTSSLKNFKHGWENDMGANMATLFARGGVSPKVKLLGQPQTLKEET